MSLSPTDWNDFWKRLVERQQGHWDRTRPKGDFWAGTAGKFDDTVRRHWAARPDSSRRFIESWLRERPGSTALDIGAGSGRWTAFMAPLARKVTVVEPSRAMLEILRRGLAENGIVNVDIHEASWPLDPEPEPHDLVLASHVVYGVKDLRGFVQAMERAAGQACLMLLRAPLPHGLMARASRLIHGHPHDSPNFHIAYNVLLDMGVQADVLVEDCGLWEPKSSESPAKALEEIKSRLNPPDDFSHDGELRALLDELLAERDGRWFWPADTRTALVHWDRERFSS